MATLAVAKSRANTVWYKLPNKILRASAPVIARLHCNHMVVGCTGIGAFGPSLVLAKGALLGTGKGDGGVFPRSCLPAL